MHTNRSRLKGFLTYLAAVIVVFGVHAYALHLDTEAQKDVRAQMAQRQS